MIPKQWNNKEVWVTPEYRIDLANALCICATAVLISVGSLLEYAKRDANLCFFL